MWHAILVIFFLLLFYLFDNFMAHSSTRNRTILERKLFLHEILLFSNIYSIDASNTNQWTRPQKCRNVVSFHWIYKFTTRLTQLFYFKNGPLRRYVELVGGDLGHPKSPKTRCFSYFQHECLRVAKGQFVLKEKVQTCRRQFNKIKILFGLFDAS